MNWNDLFSYNPLAGDLIWKRRCFNSIRATASWNAQYEGRVAGTKRHKNGRPHRIDIRINGMLYSAHQVVWEMHNNSIPEGLEIDHIDRNPFNNRLSNLRISTRAQNMHNTGLRKSSIHKVKGVTPEGKKWKAVINFNKKNVYLGLFRTKGLAAVAYAKASLRYHGVFSYVISRRRARILATCQESPSTISNLTSGSTP